MIKPPVKATDALEKPPAAKPLPSRWIPEDDAKPRVNTSYKKCQDSLAQDAQERTQDNKSIRGRGFKYCHYGGGGN